MTRPAPQGAPRAAAMASLLEQLQGIIERTYRLETGIRDVGAFVIAEEGFRRIYGGDRPPDRARLLLRADRRGALRARIFYPALLIRQLEARHPLRMLDATNVDAFNALVEELDHLLLLADRARRGANANLLELELQANVTKALMLRQLLARHLGRPLARPEESWVRWHVLEKGSFAEADPLARSRYAEARRLARKVLDHLGSLEPTARLAWLRSFARTPGPRRLRQADALPRCA